MEPDTALINIMNLYQIWVSPQSKSKKNVGILTFGSLYLSLRHTLRFALSAFLCKKSASLSILPGQKNVISKLSFSVGH